MSDVLIYILVAAVAITVGYFVAVALKKKEVEEEYRKIENKKKEDQDANKKSLEKNRKKLTAEIKEELATWKNEYNKKNSFKAQKLNEQEKRLIQKEENLDKRYINLDNKEKDLNEREKTLLTEKDELEVLKSDLSACYEEQKRELEKISGLTVNDAKEMMIAKYESEAKLEAAQRIRKIEEELKDKRNLMAKDVVSMAIQRIASEHVISSAVTVIDLPNDEMKGRIIGREGRNIRALENATGVDFIVDDTPEAIIVSSFDPVRREIAKKSMEALISDGRIHPARVEEVVDKVKSTFDDYLREIGENTVVDLGIQDINPELYYYLGKLQFRTSYGQNALQHSKEVAMLSAFMAKELGVSEAIAKRAGLLHDIGKSIDRETEGTHTQLSVELARKYGESRIVQEAIESHHMDVDFTSVEGVLVQAADSISAARPGARREIFETYIKRLEKLEGVSKSFDGVNKAYALRAGREVRVIVDSNDLDDNKTFVMSKDIARKVQDELEYPGQIKVTVIREVRAVEYAK